MIGTVRLSIIVLLTAVVLMLFLIPRERWTRGRPRPWYRTFEGALAITIIYAAVAFVFCYVVLGDPLLSF
jgi:hypothetical protein